MPRFFTGSLEGDRIAITGQDARHIALSLRMAVGETVTLCDGRGTDATGKIVSASPDEVTVEIDERHRSLSEPETELTLYQAMPKSDKMETIVQKAVELGAARIVPVMTSRCISRPDEKQMKKKAERLGKIAAEAAMQSGRGRIPEVGEMLTFGEALAEMSKADLPVMFYEHANASFTETMESFKGRTVAVLIGSEGGFSAEEAEKASLAGIKCLSLGPRILRCETAPLAAISAIMYSLGEMEAK